MLYGTAKDVMEAVKRRGGKAFLVGGAVVDWLLKIEPKDLDIEVHGLPFDMLTNVLIDAGFNPKEVGKEFGILKVGDLDISVPRRENKTGSKHKDFDVTLDHTMSPKEAARRRDLTINSMFMDLDTLEIIDPFGGKKDLEEGRLRATDEKTFVEDPLRVLRIMQLLPRKGKFVDPKTIELSKSLTDHFDTLAKERVMEEFVKLLLKADKPSMGLRFLLDADWLKHFPELNALVGVPHNPEWHPEGDVWEHTVLTVDAAASVRQYIPDDWKLAFMFGALAHDFGKPTTTDYEALTSYGHDKAGEEPARKFMERLTNEVDLIEKVVKLVVNHMQPYFLDSGRAGLASWRRLHNKVRLDVLGWLALCDRASSDPSVLRVGHKRSIAAWKAWMLLGAEPEPVKPVLMGRHLIERGHKPGPEFGSVLKEAYEMQLDDDTLGVEDLYQMVMLRPTGKDVTTRVREAWKKGGQEAARKVLEEVFSNLDDEDVEWVGTGSVQVQGRLDTGYWFLHTKVE